MSGHVIKASVASSITLAMGYGWMSVNERLLRMSEEEAQRVLRPTQPDQRRAVIARNRSGAGGPPRRNRERCSTHQGLMPAMGSRPKDPDTTWQTTGRAAEPPSRSAGRPICAIQSLVTGTRMAKKRIAVDLEMSGTANA